MSKLNSATMNPDSEVSADLITEKDREERKNHYNTLKNDKIYTTTTDILIDFTPAGTLKDVYEIVKGEKFLSEEKIDPLERLSLITSFTKGISHINDLTKSIKHSKSILNSVDKNTAHSSMNASLLNSKPDFYVGPNGPSSTLPSTAYRYMRSEKYSLIKDTKVDDLSYFGFQKFDYGSQARDAFQIKYDEVNYPDNSWSDARLRGTFDTLQLYDNNGVPKVRIPKTYGDSGKELEPFTVSYPEYGKGGALQLVPRTWDENLKIQYDKLEIIPNKKEN
ncbi:MULTISPECIES: hypothetical protein [Fusobacterium]|uniref:hypothetical protein n=1 Tax=Fusobacterium TaxID=848 RepID=UPI0025BEB5AC|nr:hypothetical protein [Fusobacterium sp.]MCI7223125.1 hypothetical protein [Fusobacterium sp.]MDY5306661.1 hypothetical protein [Fusobacterium gastrosuis]MDY5795080.1 hypothetical protein [Fusobacterium gastrosuis]